MKSRRGERIPSWTKVAPNWKSLASECRWKVFEKSGCADAASFSSIPSTASNACCSVFPHSCRLLPVAAKRQSGAEFVVLVEFLWGSLALRRRFPLQSFATFRPHPPSIGFTGASSVCCHRLCCWDCQVAVLGPECLFLLWFVSPKHDTKNLLLQFYPCNQHSGDIKQKTSSKDYCRTHPFTSWIRIARHSFRKNTSMSCFCNVQNNIIIAFRCYLLQIFII